MRASFRPTLIFAKERITNKDSDERKKVGRKKLGIVNQTDTTPSPVLPSRSPKNAIPTDSRNGRMSKYDSLCSLSLLFDFVDMLCTSSRFLNIESRHKIKLSAVRLMSESVSVNFTIRIKKVPNKAIIKTKVAKPSACFRNRFS